MSKQINLFVFGLACIILLQQTIAEASIHVFFATNDYSQNNTQNQSDTNYRIKHKDILLIRIYGVCTLTPDFIVDESGNLRLPMFGEIKAAGKTLSEFENDLIEKLKKHLKNPKVNITIAKKSDE